MADFIWCHGPHCHTKETQDRVRGSKGSKVLRTKKIKQHTNSGYYSPDSIYNYFCSQNCIFDFWNANAQRVVALAPRTTPLETPIDVKTETRQDYYGRDYQHKYIDKLSNVGQYRTMETKTNHDYTRRNRFTGESIELTEEEAIKHDQIFYHEVLATLEDKTLGTGASKHWDIMRKHLDWFRKNNAKAYMVLLD